MYRTIITYLMLVIASVVMATHASAQPHEMPGREQISDYRDHDRGFGKRHGRLPYGGYCPRKHADQYGARQPVDSPGEARDRLSRFFGVAPSRIIRLEERRHVFLAEILWYDATVPELVIIDRRTGRIRSIR